MSVRVVLLSITCIFIILLHNACMFAKIELDDYLSQR